jgi:hypothetical protein
MTKEPEALKLAKSLEQLGADIYFTHRTEDLEAATIELRRLHEANEELDKALKLALETLEGLFVTHPHYTDERGGAVAVWKLGGSYAARDAIEKIKSTLAQPKQQEKQND